MSGVIFPDVSEFQLVVNDSYSRDWLSFRVCDGNYRDRHFAANLAWVKKAVARGDLLGYTVYCVYRPGVDTFDTVKAMVGAPDKHITVMVDVESWGGSIRGNHSAQITALVDQLAGWLGDKRRVLAYGNQGDLASIYPHRPSWLKLVVASYGSLMPNVRNMIAWQYSDGQSTWPMAHGLSRTSAPFGHCDHNVAPGLTAPEFAAALGVGTPTPKPVPPQEDDVSAADVIAALKSKEGQALLTDAVKPFFHDAHGKQVSADTILADRLSPITAQLKAIAADVAAIKAAKS